MLPSEQETEAQQLAKQIQEECQEDILALGRFLIHQVGVKAFTIHLR
jgi:hypothetical protein